MLLSYNSYTFVSILMDVQTYIARIDTLSAKFNDSFSKLSDSDMNMRINSNSWSIAQIIDHICVINSSYFSTFDQIAANTYKSGFISKIGFLVNAFGKMILSSVETSRKRKIKTFPIWEPSTQPIQEVLHKLIENHKELKAKLQSIADIDSEKTIISSPANKHIVYTLSKALEILLTHEERHFNQAMEVKEKLHIKNMH
ncbi:MAG: DinB family protein [Bacteroidia bacterium]